MKRAAYIFILLFCFGVKAISAKTGSVFALKQLSGLSKYENHSQENYPTSVFNSKNFPSTNKILKEKKDRQRGLVTVFYLFIDDCSILINCFNKKLFFESQKFYILRLFLGNEKRGPPTIFVS